MHKEGEESSYVQVIEMVMKLPLFECLAQTNNHSGFDRNTDKHETNLKISIFN